MSDPTKADIVKLIRNTYGLSLMDAKALLESMGATERTPTKRELFAAMAMQGLMRSFGTDSKGAARLAVMNADDLLAELEKGK